jgi:hypothetical protein
VLDAVGCLKVNRRRAGEYLPDHADGDPVDLCTDDYPPAMREQSGLAATAPAADAYGKEHPEEQPDRVEVRPAAPPIARFTSGGRRWTSVCVAGCAT